MDFRQLEAYIKIIELGSFSKSADLMFLSQPSISYYMKGLEKELGTQLIMRSTRELTPTRSGKIFYEYAKNIIALKEKAVFSIKSRSQAAAGEIEIHASSVPAQHILPDSFVSFHEKYPNISFHIVQSDTQKVMDNILSQKCEIGVVGANFMHQKCNYELIVAESLVMIAPPNWANKSQVVSALKQVVEGQNIIVREEGSATRYYADQFLRENGIKPEKIKVIANFSNTQSILYAVSKGLGISIVSAIAAHDYIKEKKVAVIKLKENLPTRNFNFVYKKDVILSPQINLLMHFVTKRYQERLD